MIEIIGHALSQWDVGRSVQITGIEADHAHFANKGDSKAVIMGVADTKAKIPDYLLQTGKQLCVYAVKDGITVESKTFYVQKRERPENYVYEDDQRNYIYELIASAETAVEDANKAADSANEAAENANAAAKAFGDIGKNFVKTVNGVAPDENGNVNVEGGAVSWDDITDKPFGEEVVYYAWDKDTEYETSVDAPLNEIATKLVKLSNDAPDSSFFLGKTLSCSAINNGEDTKIYTTITEDLFIQLPDKMYAVSDSAIVVIADSVTEGGITLTRGVWAVSGYLETSPIQFLWWKIFDPLKQIDESLIPDTIARVNNVVRTVNGIAPDENGNVNVESGSGGYVGVEPADDDIPKVFISGVKPTTKDDVLAEMQYISKTDNFHAYLTIKCQGTSSMAYDKKNFTVKMYSDEARETKLKKSFKDWNHNGNKYVLKANWIDHTHARNIVCARLWDEVVSSRPDYDTLPEEMRNSPRNGAIDGFPVKVYYNGTYEGIYTWNIGKDDWMWNMDEDNPNHVLLCAETNSGRNTYDEHPCNFRKLWNGVHESNWSVEVGTNSDAVKTALNNLIQFVMDNDGDAFRNGIENHLDIQSAIDYYIMQYVICGTDGLAKNMLLATYNGTKWICGAYDMDAVFGLWWNGVSFAAVPTYRCPEDYQEPNSLLWERIEANFTGELKERYSELRKTVLSYPNMVTHFERFMDVIGKDLYEEDLVPYPAIPLADTNNIQQIRDYIRDRLQYVDGQIGSLVERIPCDSIQIDKSVIEFTAEGTQIITATVFPENTTDSIVWNSSDRKVASVENGVVTAVGNGECTITARCGEHSTSCNVYVSGVGEDTSLLYKLDGTKVMNGTSDYIDTGVKPYVEDIDLTFLIDFQNSDQAGTHAWRQIIGGSIDNSSQMIVNAWMTDGTEESGLIKFRYFGNERILSNANNQVASLASRERIRVAVRKSAAETTIKCGYSLDGVVCNSWTTGSSGMSAYTFSAGEQNVILGARLNASGVAEHFWTGTLYNFEIYNRVMTDDEVTAFLTGQN